MPTSLSFSTPAAPGATAGVRAPLASVDRQAAPPDEAAALQARLAESERRCAALVAERDDIFRVIAHDLRAPLRHITSFGQLVRESLHEPGGVQEAGDYLDIMDRSARYMGRMIDGLNDLAQLSRAAVQPVPLDLQALIAEVRAELHAEAAGRDIAWSLPQVPLQVVADAALLRTVWRQLLGNAVKFTRGQAPAVIDIGWKADGDDTVFTLRDNGAGFDPAQAGRLFGVFQRLHRESDFEGVGAGLALARCAVERLGGRITIDGAVHKGCTVRFTVPATLS